VETASRDVALSIPARPGYLVLARLALSAVCRLTALEPVEVADLKLAVTESANEFIVEDEDEAEDTLDFEFRLSPDALVMELSGQRRPDRADEQELGRAIIDATVDESQFDERRTMLVKRLG